MSLFRWIVTAVILIHKGGMRFVLFFPFWHGSSSNSAESSVWEESWDILNAGSNTKQLSQGRTETEKSVCKMKRQRKVLEWLTLCAETDIKHYTTGRKTIDIAMLLHCLESAMDVKYVYPTVLHVIPLLTVEWQDAI